MHVAQEVKPGCSYGSAVKVLWDCGVSNPCIRGFVTQVKSNFQIKLKGITSSSRILIYS